MSQMLIAFEGEKTRQRMTEIFESAGIQVAGTCGSGAEILRRCGYMSGGVVLCGYKLFDMTAEELYENLPHGIPMVLLATPFQLENCGCEDICRVAAPAHKGELIDSVRMLLNRQEVPAPVPQRSAEDKLLITKAKELLMERNQMTEAQAHRFIQKLSMDTGAKMIQTAMRILDGQLVV